jgi:hypothetical protein
MEKVCVFSKNQAVNLQQILIHGQMYNGFVDPFPVKITGSRFTTAFQGNKRHCYKACIAKDFAAKLLQSTPWFLLPTRIESSKAFISSNLFPHWLQRPSRLPGKETKHGRQAGAMNFH